MSLRGIDVASDPPGGLVPGLDALGTYHLIRPLATGGMARVWLAVDSRSGREVAVKRMRPELALDPELRRSFIDEAQLGLMLRHPHLVETVELGESTTANGVEPYLVLELLQGRALIDILRTAARHKRKVPLSALIRVVVDAARGLDHAHKLAGADGRPLGVVHRDVTPHNLFVCQSGLTKVLDFGIAKAQSQQHKTRTGTVKGKFAYLAPEQIRGGAVDARLDVFTLGIVLYELLTGRPLFRGGNDAETLHRVLTFDVPSPDTLRDDVPAGLGAIALRALQRDRDRRLPSAAAFADSIEAVAEAEQIHATAEAVHGFVTRLFPDDAREHAEDTKLARRTYEHLSSASLRAITSNPWMTPAHGLPSAEEPRRRWSAALAPWIGGLCLTAAAAVLTVMFLSRHPAPPHATAAVTAEPQHASAPEMPAPSAPVPTPRGAPRDQAKPPPRASADAHGAPSRSHEHHEHASEGKHHGTGLLRLAAQPWAEVTIDGRPAGVTPMRPISLSEGNHTVVLTNNQLGVTVKRHVTIQNGAELPLVIDLFNARSR